MNFTNPSFLSSEQLFEKEKELLFMQVDEAIETLRKDFEIPEGEKVFKNLPNEEIEKIRIAAREKFIKDRQKLTLIYQIQNRSNDLTKSQKRDIKKSKELFLLGMERLEQS